MNKIIVYIFALLLAVPFTEVKAQHAKQQKSFSREAFESQRNAFITAELQLTPEDAAVFIPLCNELQRKKFEVNQECRKKSRNIRKSKNSKSLTDEDYKQAIDICLDSRIKEAELEKEYYSKFLEILTPEQLYKYRNAEIKFARKFIKERSSKED